MSDYSIQLLNANGLFKKSTTETQRNTNKIELWLNYKNLNKILKEHVSAYFVTLTMFRYNMRMRMNRPLLKQLEFRRLQLILLTIRMMKNIVFKT